MNRNPKPGLIQILLPLFLFAFTIPAVAQDDPVVIRLGEKVETLVEFDERFEIAIKAVVATQRMQLTDAIRAQFAEFRPGFLEQRVTSMVLLKAAKDRGISFPEDLVQARMDEIRVGAPSAGALDTLLNNSGFSNVEQLRQVLGETEQIQQVMRVLKNDIKITTAELANYYYADQERFVVEEGVCARHILQEVLEEAQDTLADLKGGADFEQVAMDRSTGPSGPAGGDLGCFTRGRMVAPFEEAAFGAEIGVPVGPVETQFGFHTILVYERQDGGTAPFSDVRDQIEDEIRQTRISGVLETLIEESGVQSFPELLKLTPAQEGVGETDFDEAGDENNEGD
jgi:peptidyl-prolyl cis-trans isomerase C